MSKGQQEKALDSAVFAAKKGKVEGPVKTQFGYYVFQVTKVKKASQQTLKQAKETIRNLLRSQREQKALDEFVKDFRDRLQGRDELRQGLPGGGVQERAEVEDRHAARPRAARPAARSRCRRAPLRRARRRRARLRRARTPTPYAVAARPTP